ncbi:MAG: ATP-binding cassette domain-containing protein [Desulfobulbaceae bacterium]|jgi:branched-chain amino acid transport system ATP-binding protein|nr:ATP-binding cassette domain-containing protein [Desulfobulbaceae bacterium]
MNILSIRHVSLRFSGDDGGLGAPLLNDLSLEVSRARVSALIGGNGAGKTTLFNVISGFQRADGGEIIFDSSTDSIINKWPPWRIARLGIGRLFQGRQLSPSLSLLDNFKLASRDTSGEFPFSRLWRRAELRRAERAKEERARAILTELFGDDCKYLAMLDRPGGAFSYGEQRLLALARLLMPENVSLLLLDEPTAGVNPALCESIAAMIRRVAHERGISVFLIEHNLPFVREVADDCAYMADGKIVKSGSVAAALDAPEAREHYLAVFTNDEGRAVAEAAPVADEKIESLAKPKSPPALLLSDISGGYDASRDILQGASLRIDQGESVGVVGLNGSGKSTLGRAVMNMLPRRTGTVEIGGHDVSPLSAAALAGQGVALMMQGAPVFNQLTVGENLRLAVLARNEMATGGETPDGAARSWRPSQPADQLSGGQRHQLALRLILTGCPKLLILDEPSAGLDPTAAAALYETLARIRAESGVAILLIEQNVRLARDFCHRLMVMEQGRLEKAARRSA